MLQAEHMTQLVSQHRQQIHSPGCCATRSEFFIGIGSGMDKPAEAGGVMVDPDAVPGYESLQIGGDDMPSRESQQVAR